MCRVLHMEAQCQPILQLMTACWKRPRRSGDTERNERPSQSRYKSISNIENNKKSSLCLGKLTTSVVMITSASARQSAYECARRHVRVEIGRASCRERV